MSALLLSLALALAQAPAPDAGADAGTPAAAAPAAAAPAALAEAAPTQAVARAVPARVLLGEPFVYQVVLTHPRDLRYDLVVPRELAGLEVLEQTRERKDGPDASVTTLGLKVAAFTLGPQALPPLQFEVLTPDGPRRYTGPGAEVEVVSSLPAEAEEEGAGLADLREPVEVPVRSWRLVAWAAALLALALVAWAVVRAVARARARPAVAPPPRPLEERTREALHALAAEGLPELGRSREFYFRLSEIVRGYLGERYAFEALECTSPELMQRLRQLSPPGLPEEGLMRFVSESDLVRYAREEAPPERCRAALDFAHHLLDATRPAPVVPPPSLPTAPAPDAAGPRVP